MDETLNPDEQLPEITEEEASILIEEFKMLVKNHRQRLQLLFNSNAHVQHGMAWEQYCNEVLDLDADGMMDLSEKRKGLQCLTNCLLTRKR